MIPRERILTALKIGIPDRVPWMEGIIEDGIASRLIGEKVSLKWSIAPNGLPTISGGEQAEIQKKICQILGKDNINYNAFAPIYAEKMTDKNGKEIVGNGLIKTWNDLDIMDFPDPKDKNFYEPAKDFIAYKGDYCAVACIRLGIGATIMSMGIDGFSLALVDSPGLVEEVLSRYANWTKEVIPILEDIGFDIFWAFDDVAFGTGPMFSPELYRSLVLPILKDVANTISIPWISHSDGNMNPILDDWLSLGQNGIHPIQPDCMDIFDLKKRYGNRVCLVGNVDMNLLINGTPEEVRSQVERLIKEVGYNGGYIISSSNSLTDEMKVENVRTMIETIQDAGWYGR